MTNACKPTKQLSDKRVGIVGLGRIGLPIAKRAESFGCLISYHSRSQRPDTPYTYHASPLFLASACDILLLACTRAHPGHAPTTWRAAPSWTRWARRARSSTSRARGLVVDEPQMVRALLDGRIGAAGLDVYEREPEVPGSCGGWTTSCCCRTPPASPGRQGTRSVLIGIPGWWWPTWMRSLRVCDLRASH